MPDNWEVQPGWTKYHYRADGSSYSEHVEFPQRDDGSPEEALAFDVETLPAEHPYAILACAASPTAWYAWLSPWLLGRSSSPAHLVPLGPPHAPRIVAGHNVSYDRARVREEYRLAGTRVRWVDTMALHVAVHGIAGHQRPAWAKWRKGREQRREQRSEAAEAVVEMMRGVEREEEQEGDAGRRDALRRVRREMEESLPLLEIEGEEGEGDVGARRWEDVTSANSLAEVARLHCGLTLDKSTRADFLALSAPAILQNLPTYLAYCAADVHATHAVFSKVLPGFLQRCPHPVSFAGILTMGSSFLTVERGADGWEGYLERAEGVYQCLEGRVRGKLRELAEAARGMMESGDWRTDVWLSQLDWTPKVAGKSRGVGVDPPEEERFNLVTRCYLC